MTDICEGLCSGIWMSWCVNSTIGQDWCSCCDCRCNCCWDGGELPPEDEDNAQRRDNLPSSYSATAITPPPDATTSPIPRPEKLEYAPAPEMSVPASRP